ncbi:3'-5' exonuclease [Roseomonas sp. OT10]|uniref:3'-5' exonuclease n=1 Tax=Roseomonas cutis TaxID=2897332 RepID=UPI001E34CCE9|nr:3'-5' exonuclease [Roseomonas sp. OT10]UFN48625.1 3'-5' exonuclease [Roseomonas sp. OT10]
MGPILPALRRAFYRVSLGDHSYRFLFGPEPKGEAVSLDCETTGLDRQRDDIVSIAAVRLVGNRILLSERFQATIQPEAALSPASIRIHGLRARDLEGGEPIRQVLPRLLRFIGSRPLVGYYLDFDVAMLDRHVLPMIQAKLPNRRIEISALYYRFKYGHAPPGTVVDLRFPALLEELGIPLRRQHDALGDAVAAAEAYLQLVDMAQRRVRPHRKRAAIDSAPPTGA